MKGSLIGLGAIVFALVVGGFVVYRQYHSGYRVLSVGQKAPSFTLQSDTGESISLDSLRGKRVVLYFYPKDRTPLCSTQAQNIRDNFDIYKKNNIEVLGISYDSPESHAAFRKEYNLPFSLLSDPKASVTKAYGAYGGPLRELFPQRMTFLIDEQGMIVDIIEHVDVRNHTQQVFAGFKIPYKS